MIANIFPNFNTVSDTMKVSVLIPAYNEGKSIKKSIEAILAQSRKADEVIVVNDGSTDNTLEILDSFGGKVTVVSHLKNYGNKSLAQQTGLKFVTGDIVVTSDADTLLDKNFIKNLIPNFEDKNVAAVSGYVKSLKNNWITASREIDYIIGQEIYKTAQDFMNYILVIPGCAAAFRMETFHKHVEIDHDTITEDLDFTYQLHKKGFRIAFEKTAIVYTQDPPNISSYIRQMKRWYGGGWQNLLKHSDIAVSRPAAALELGLTYVEGLIAGVMILVIPLMNLSLFFERLLPIYVVVLGFVALLASIKDRRIDLLYSFPGYLLLNYINAVIFFAQFIKEGLLRKRTLTWVFADRTEI